MTAKIKFIRREYGDESIVEQAANRVAAGQLAKNAIAESFVNRALNKGVKGVYLTEENSADTLHVDSDIGAMSFDENIVLHEKDIIQGWVHAKNITLEKPKSGLWHRITKLLSKENPEEMDIDTLFKKAYMKSERK